MTDLTKHLARLAAQATHATEAMQGTSVDADGTPLRIAVVGHTNTGKTSLLRTLTRDVGFGEVSSRPSTTRHVEGARLLADGRALVALFDTPGMEDPVALLDELESLVAQTEGGSRLDGPARIGLLLASAAAHERFEQEAKVLRCLMDSDAGLYVIDARDPVLAKHRDELALLGGCAVPLLPVLNFVRDEQANEGAWREALARLGLHTVVRFDTVAPERDGERLLYEKLATVLDARRPALEALAASREREARARHAAALRMIAELLIDAAAARLLVEEGEEEGGPSPEEDAEAPFSSDAAKRQVAADADGRATAALAELNRRVGAREGACVQALLKLYRFRHDDVDAAQLPLIDGRWEDDLFHAETLRDMGVRLGSGAAAGAVAGLGVDMMVGGLTMGAAAAIGALAGGGWQAVRHLGDRIVGKLTGRQELSVDDAILRLLALRQLHLLRALASRGHAAMVPIRQFAATAAADEWREGALPKPLHKARAHPEWSTLNQAASSAWALLPSLGEDSADAAREAAIEALAAQLADSAGAP